MDLEHLKRLLREQNIRLRRDLSQNFMVDDQALRRVVEYANITGNDVVLEIGGGLGFLTKLLATRARRVITIEKDPRLAAVLRKMFEDEERVEILEGDFLKMGVPKYNKVASNPPYASISKIIFKLLGERFDCGVLTLQKEFAERMAACPGHRNYGRLTVMSYVKAEVELLEALPPSAFYPPPEVASTITRIQPRRELPFKVADWKLFEEVVRTLFTQRNRTVKKALKILLRSMHLPKLEAASLPAHLLDRRVFTLTPEEFGVLADAIYGAATHSRV
ncbi:MAG: 16S rRNA (adenine(1518)-N(6)/adenine(1519)-N(6))-dimethyltransferase RsmA [Candidatus Bathyarchaeia archaeon]